MSFLPVGTLARSLSPSETPDGHPFANELVVVVSPRAMINDSLVWGRFVTGGAKGFVMSFRANEIRPLTGIEALAAVDLLEELERGVT